MKIICGKYRIIDYLSMIQPLHYKHEQHFFYKHLNHTPQVLERLKDGTV